MFFFENGIVKVLHDFLGGASKKCLNQNLVTLVTNFNWPSMKCQAMILYVKKSGNLAIFVRFVYEVLHVNESKLIIWRMLVMLL